MSGQLSIETFFSKSKSGIKTARSCNKSHTMDAVPLKSLKVDDADVVNLVSDDEDMNESIPQCNYGKSPRSDASEDTIAYSLTPERTESSTGTPQNLTPRTNKTEKVTSPVKGSPSPPESLLTPPIKTENIKTLSLTQSLHLTPEIIKTENIGSSSTSNSPETNFTPSKSSPIQPLKVHTPASITKYYSPNKKRMVYQRNSNQVRRDLNMEMNKPGNTSRALSDDVKGSPRNDNPYTAACQEMDDRTILLLSIINKCLSDPSLRQLMDSESQQLLTSCFRVAKPGMKLISKLYWRKEGWYKKNEVNDICSEDRKERKHLDDVSFEAMIDSLEKSKLIVKGDNNNMTFDDFERVLSRDDYVQICKTLKINTSSKKDAIEALRNFSKRKSISNFFTGPKSDNSTRVLKMMREKAGLSYKLSDFARRTLYKLYILVYLGIDYTIIREKRLEFLLLYDKIHRETYPVNKDVVCDNASVVFETREEFDKYVAAHDIYEEFLAQTDVTIKCATVKQVFDMYQTISEDDMERYKNLPVWLRRYTPASKYVSILESGIQDLKKNKEGSHNLLALKILKTLTSQSHFKHHKKAKWYAEQALILHSLLDRCDEAAELLIEGFNAPDIAEDAKDYMRPRARKIALQKNKPVTAELKARLLELADSHCVAEAQFDGVHIYKQPMERAEQRGKIKFETRTTEGRTVQEAEEYCIGHYITSGEFTDGEHWEGRIVTTIFFLLFWEIIYTPPRGIRGVFLTPYQRFPLDMFCEGFYKNRRKAIDERLKFIEEATEDILIEIMQNTWDNRPESELSGITRAVGWENIKMVAKCLKPKGVAAICRRLAQSYHYAHSGFPDLTVWNRHNKRIKFVEVKTDTDKPSTKQIQWMKYLRENGIETEFCYVGVNTTRQRSRAADKISSKRKSPASGKGTPKKRPKKQTETPRKRKSKVTKEQTRQVEIKGESSDNDFEDAHLTATSTSKGVAIKKEPLDNDNSNVFRPECDLTHLMIKREVQDHNIPVKIKEELRANDRIIEVQIKLENENEDMTVTLKSNKIRDEVYAGVVPTNKRLVFEMSDEVDNKETSSPKSLFKIRERLKNNKENNNTKPILGLSEKCTEIEIDGHSIHSEDTLILTPPKLSDSDETVHSVNCDCGETLHLS